MKNAMKKIMSLLLVVMLLVSAAPFALADGLDNVTITVKFTDRNGNEYVPAGVPEEYLTSDWEKGTTVQDLWDEFTWGCDVASKSWSANLAKDHAITENCTVTIRVDEVINAGTSDTVPGVEVIKPVEVAQFTLVHMVNGKVNWSDKVNAGELTYEDMELSYFTGEEGYKYSMTSKIYGKDYKKTALIPDGDTVTIRLVTDYSNGSSNGGSNGNGSSGNGTSGNGSSNSGSTTTGTANGSTYTFNGPGAGKGQTYEVKLHVFLNGDVDTIHKAYVLNNNAAKDGKVTMAEVKELLRSKYNAKNSDGIEYDGLYLGTGDWAKKYASDDPKYSTIDGLETIDHNVDIYIMLRNAKASTGTADSSNPKTGDNIMIAVTTMALAGAALVSVMELKKRKMI